MVSAVVRRRAARISPRGCTRATEPSNNGARPGARRTKPRRVVTPAGLRCWQVGSGSRGHTPDALEVGVLGAAPSTERRRLRPALMPGFFHDRGHRRIGDEALPALLVPVEHHPHAVLLIGVAE